MDAGQAQRARSRSWPWQRRDPAEYPWCEALPVAADLVYPLFVIEGKDRRTPIPSLPGIEKLSPDLLVAEATSAFARGIRAVALFPAIDESRKDPWARESCNPDGLLPRIVRALKAAVPELFVITDVAMDPYSSEGHDGLMRDGRICNDETLPILASMAVTQAAAGADIVAPSDMMDGRVAVIRAALDENDFSTVGICAYSAKYASAFYGPFRDALGSAPRAGDKKTYQMNPANSREAGKEVRQDILEGADFVMVKPALAYLDVIQTVGEISTVPVAAYNVSGEYAMLKAAVRYGGLDEAALVRDTLRAIKRAGADLIFTYHAHQALSGGWL